MRRRRWRCCAVKRESGGTRRMLTARQRRMTAPIRSIPSGPSGTIAATGIPEEASLVRKRRMDAAPVPYRTLWPSGPVRTSSKESSVRRGLSIEGRCTPEVRMTVPGSASGAQNTAVSVAASDGSIGKAQPPATADHHREPIGISGWMHSFSIVSLITIIAPEPFPREIRCGQIVDVVVRRG